MLLLLSLSLSPFVAIVAVAVVGCVSVIPLVNRVLKCDVTNI